VSPDAVLLDAVRAARRADGRPLVLGLCGPQGSGKSTLAARLAAQVPGAAILSLDDLYRTRAERVAMAASVHPLFATRGVPGTHDVALGEAAIAALDAGAPATLPRFDKATDDRAPRSAWDRAAAGCPLLILEGWCVGAAPQDAAALSAPVNALERDEDPDGVWRRAVDAALARDYRRLFARIDLLVLLRPPAFETVLGWRLEQEHALRAARDDGAGVMDDAAVARFVQHYERLTRHILAEMSARADLVIDLDADRRVVRTTHKGVCRSGADAYHSRRQE